MPDQNPIKSLTHKGTTYRVGDTYKGLTIGALSTTIFNTFIHAYNPLGLSLYLLEGPATVNSRGTNRASTHFNNFHTILAYQHCPNRGINKLPWQRSEGRSFLAADPPIHLAHNLTKAAMEDV